MGLICGLGDRHGWRKWDNHIWVPTKASVTRRLWQIGKRSFISKHPSFSRLYGSQSYKKNSFWVPFPPSLGVFRGRRQPKRRPFKSLSPWTKLSRHRWRENWGCLYLWVNTLSPLFKDKDLHISYQSERRNFNEGIIRNYCNKYSGLILAPNLGNHIWKSIGVPQICQSASEQAELAQIIQRLGRG